MDRFIIYGGVPLRGTVHISGAKNAALPCLAACLLTEQPVVLENIPAVRDIATTCHLLRILGVALE
ncbi:MAG: UDP-N-acetylglucosamine 1-carboxyvinyltransferase, partial [Acidobacteria bacterium]|nr:UDP-N-acetylglucosamine 1-carboxyvinyltransferase [Acidobacteriota bacterium]